MATVTIRSQDRTLDDPAAISEFLAGHGIWYRQFQGLADLRDDAPDEEVLEVYREPIRELMESGEYSTADVINITPGLDGLEAMLNKFNKEHWHDEDEVRFIVRGRGLFHIHPDGGPIFGIEVEKGDMISVPKGTHHWFDLCEDRNIRAIRLFQDTSGWTPHYTGSGADEGVQPLCFGPTYLPGLGR
jgi:1,2-dihydroxy-3-keto-5-methylthiopentene dioxygenase